MRQSIAGRHVTIAHVALPLVRNKLGTPYCNQCGYDLTGLIDSSKCPECGSAIVEVLVRPEMRMGWRFPYRYESPRRVGGVPLLSIANGPGSDGKPGVARGVIAIGDIAVGLVAIGGRAYGGVAIGGLSVGFFAIGGWALGGLTIGGLSVGLVALGGFAMGAVAIGGSAIALIWARGGSAIQLLH